MGYNRHKVQRILIFNSTFLASQEIIEIDEFHIDANSIYVLSIKFIDTRSTTKLKFYSFWTVQSRFHFIAFPFSIQIYGYNIILDIQMEQSNYEIHISNSWIKIFYITWHSVAEAMIWSKCSVMLRYEYMFIYIMVKLFAIVFRTHKRVCKILKKITLNDVYVILFHKNEMFDGSFAVCLHGRHTEAYGKFCSLHNEWNWI